LNFSTKKLFASIDADAVVFPFSEKERKYIKSAFMLVQTNQIRLTYPTPVKTFARK
jgi:hypothetical protein